MDFKSSAKADPLLKEKLESSSPDEVARVILTLSVPDSPRRGIRVAVRTTTSNDRSKLIEARRRRLIGNADTLQKLRDLGLKPQGGQVTSTVVIEGRLADIEKALELPAVCRAALDRVLDLIRPVA